MTEILSWRLGALMLAVMALSGCSISPTLPHPLTEAARSTAGSSAEVDPAGKRELTVSSLPQPPGQSPSKAQQQRDAGEQAALKTAGQAAGGEVPAINLQQVPLPTFVQVVYAEILKRNVSLDPAVQSRKDMVTFRTGATQSFEQLDQAVRLLLKSYQLSVVDAGGLLRVLPDNAQLGAMPELRRSEAQPDTPLPLRPIFHLIEMNAVRQNEVAGWLKTLFGSRVTIQEDLSRNALLLSGTPDNVRAAMEAIRVLDQPAMGGRKSLALSPAYWSADDLGRRLIEVLTAQGYAVAPLNQLGQAGTARSAIILMPVAATNQVYVFAGSDEVLNHVTNWARQLDRPNERGIGRNYFTYQVKHKDAAVLAKTLEQLLQGGLRSMTSATAQGQPATTGGTRPSGVVVDQSTNMLIFQVAADEYSQIAALLQSLDRPAKSALIEVTVAELSVDDSSQLGVEWLFTQAVGDSGRYLSGTIGKVAEVTGGLTMRFLDGAGAVKALLNTLATNDQATILSSPRVLTRNGEQASIQVGSQVPIITSQATTSAVNAGSNSTPILQTVQYRDTGVILRVKPVIHSGDQIDLEVQQEVSAAAGTSTGVNVSPTFSTRKIDTKLTLRNGATVMMGGLLSEEKSDNKSGLPFLKDIPVLGAVFGNQKKGNRKRELVVLLTPYILNDSHDAEAITDAFRNALGPWASRQKDAAAAPANQAPKTP